MSRLLSLPKSVLRYPLSRSLCIPAGKQTNKPTHGRQHNLAGGRKQTNTKPSHGSTLHHGADKTSMNTPSDLELVFYRFFQLHWRPPGFSGWVWRVVVFAPLCVCVCVCVCACVCLCVCVCDTADFAGTAAARSVSVTGTPAQCITLITRASHFSRMKPSPGLTATGCTPAQSLLHHHNHQRVKKVLT